LKTNMFELTLTKLYRRRPLTTYDSVQAVITAVTRNRKVFADIKSPGCYLDLGCGWPAKNPEFCHLDYNWRPGVDVCWDVKRGLPLPDAYVSGIFTEHMIEHLRFDDTLALFAECRRVLRPGGVLRIVVPDGELYLCGYARHQAGEAVQLPYSEDDASRFPIATPIVSVNRIFRDYGHQFIWDFETLRAALLRSGFSTVERCSFGQGKNPKLVRDSQSRQVESLYLEAI
jgi:predicted SAM-dependent methyltransferase